MDGSNARSQPSQGCSIATALFQADFGECFICFSKAAALWRWRAARPSNCHDRARSHANPDGLARASGLVETYGVTFRSSRHGRSQSKPRLGRGPGQSR
jgi:hypothetical protein